MEENSVQKKRNRHTDRYDDLKKTLSSNLLSAIGETASSTRMAKELGFSSAAMSSWITGKRLPTVDQLVLLSEKLEVSIDDLLSSHSINDPTTTVMTYSDAFRVLRTFSDMGIVNPASVDDFFLSYLLRRTDAVASRVNVSETKKDSWYQKLLKDFSIPLQPTLEDHDMYLALADAYGEINEDDTYLAVLKVVRDYHKGKNVDKINDLYHRWLETQNPDKYWSVTFSQPQADLSEPGPVEPPADIE